MTIFFATLALSLGTNPTKQQGLRRTRKLGHLYLRVFSFRKKFPCKAVIPLRYSFRVLLSWRTFDRKMEKNSKELRKIKNSFSNLFAGIFRFLFVMFVVVIVVKVGAVVVLGLLVVDQRRVVAAAELRLDLWGGCRRLPVPCRRCNRTWPRSSTDRRVRAAAV